MLNEVFLYIKDYLEIGTILGIIGTLYFYFESRRLKKYDAQKEHKIWQSELEKIDKEHEKKKTLLDKEVHSKFEIRGGMLSDRRTTEEQDSDFNKSMELEDKFWPERTKIQAKVDFYKKMKNRSIFWFLKKEEEFELRLYKQSKFKNLFNKLFK